MKVPITDVARLSSQADYTIFSYGGKTIRFAAPYSLKRYMRVKKWHDGYLEVGADYGEGEEGAENGITTRGRNVRSTVKIEPGISPLIFTEFLLDRAVFLDLDDMSGHLPPLSERVISVSPENSTEKSMYEDYKEVIEQLSKKVKDDSREFGLMGDMLQFSLSWLDKPYTEGKTAFISPYSGDAAAAYPQYEMYRDPKMLTTKEKALIDTVKKELSEDRRCFIFLEYTNQEDTNCSDRLQKILTDAVGERVEILRSSSPEAAKREEYIHRLAEEGVRVIITNPKCCETGGAAVSA